MKISTLILLVLLLASAGFALYPEKLFNEVSPKVKCVGNAQHPTDTGATEIPPQNIINWDGTVKYFKDNFSQYSKNSRVIEQFENLTNLQINGSYGDLKLNPENYSGRNSLSLVAWPISSDNAVLSVRKGLNQPLDLERWNNSGVLSMWLKIENRKGLTGVGLKIGDKDNNYREYQSINNLQIDLPNNFDTDDAYPDVTFSSPKTAPKQWTDYWINRGWNYLFWKADKVHYQDRGNLDIKNITWFELTFNGNKNIAGQQMLLDDLRVQDGIQKESNSLGNVWYPPDNEPQKGIFELDKFTNNSYGAKLLSIPESQYPVGRSHGRMLLSYAAPVNFSMRTRFMLTDFPKNDLERVNTWFRVAYDFENAFNPNHAWYASFVSFEWNKFGLGTFIPIEKSSIEEWNPTKEKTLGISTDFTPEENTLYEIRLTVRGQKAVSLIYEVAKDCYVLKGQTSFEFPRMNRDSKARYPFLIETVGNLKAYIFYVEIKAL